MENHILLSTIYGPHPHRHTVYSVCTTTALLQATSWHQSIQNGEVLPLSLCQQTWLTHDAPINCKILILKQTCKLTHLSNCSSVGIYGTGNPVHLPSPNPYPTCVLTNPNIWCRVFQVVCSFTWRRGTFSLVNHTLHRKRKCFAVLLTLMNTILVHYS